MLCLRSRSPCSVTPSPISSRGRLLRSISECPGVALLNGFSVRATTVAAIPERVAEPGEIIKGRKSYRRLTVKELT